MSRGVMWSSLPYHSIPLAAAWRTDSRGANGSGAPKKEAAAIVWAEDLDGWTRVMGTMVDRGIVPVTDVLRRQCWEDLLTDGLCDTAWS